MGSNRRINELRLLLNMEICARWLKELLYSTVGGRLRFGSLWAMMLQSLISISVLLHIHYIMYCTVCSAVYAGLIWVKDIPYWSNIELWQLENSN